MHPEIGCDLLDRRHTIVAAASNPHDIVTELLRIRLGHNNILPGPPHGKPGQMSLIPAAAPSFTANVA